MSRGRAKSNEALDLARVYKTMIESLNKAHVLLPVPVFEECLLQFTNDVNKNLDALPGRLILALNPKDKHKLAKIVNQIVEETKKDLASIKIDVPGISRHLTERGFSFSPDKILEMVRDDLAAKELDEAISPKDEDDKDDEIVIAEEPKAKRKRGRPRKKKDDETGEGEA